MYNSGSLADGAALTRSAGVAFAVGGLAVLTVALVVGPALSGAFAVGTAVTYAAVAALAWRGLRHHRPHARFGWANRVTLVRAVITSCFAGAAAAAPSLADLHLWVLAAAGLLALALDGVDGRLARRDGTVSTFGGLFDQEVDALLILVLSALVWQLDHAPAWVLLIGAMRYAFLLLSRAVPRLRCALPQKRWRQAVCVLQVAVLLACVPPLLSPGIRTASLLFALAALAASFAADVWALLSRTPRQIRPD